MLPDPAPTLRLPAALVARLYDRSRAGAWDLDRERFEAALRASLAHAFLGVEPMAREVEQYLESLQIEDLALAAACAAGSEPAWDYFVREYRPLLHRAADAIDPSGNARDLADSLYAELYGLPGRQGARAPLLRYFHGRSRLSTWLRAVLAQRYVDRLRTGRKLDPLPDDPESLPARSTPMAPLAGERARFLQATREALSAAIAGLTPRDRLRLSCYYAQDLTLAAIGRMLKEHEATVSRHLARTRAEVRAALEARLRAHHGMDAAIVADCIRSVIEDAGTLDLADLLGAATVGKNAPADRSRE